MKKEKCKYCDGLGRVNVFLAEDTEVVKDCPICKGTGKVKPKDNLDIKMPLWVG